jgi:hypothetical protein
VCCPKQQEAVQAARAAGCACSGSGSLDTRVEQVGQEVEERIDHQRAEIFPEKDCGVGDLQGTGFNGCKLL